MQLITKDIHWSKSFNVRQNISSAETGNISEMLQRSDVDRRELTGVKPESMEKKVSHNFAKVN